ncbi:phosphoadenosine phosphosulfate reductase family protein [Hirsutella rhossiliensis]|uniref:FAD synthase n=1 Tax=Hirsutella rhossiliensis TaxID=111463 RepID=A0A9P8MUG1_9HYPO|nr:phosphoadenosine phosphosulfate reductase family domain-containing protein [Hirsutella rhossiliensis]KAH0962348.1 phosphoadenosine phosphosulfate reductase family domain-containing protein [Hirsutella rhossiliensis]
MTQPAEPPTNGATKPRAAGHDGPRPWPEICSVLRRKVSDLLRLPSEDDAVLRNTQLRARESLAVISEALQRYGRNELSLSYNGGKDCLVLLILILACLPDPTQPLSASADGPATETPTKSHIEPLQAIYIAPPDPFPEVEDFVAVSTSHYHLDLTRYALPMRDALEAYRADRPPVKAIFMGTRRTDPHSEFLMPFSPTDDDWPGFMRVNPVLDWHYPEIWAFIRHLDIAFCSLYNRGFTSLGGTRNTRPNPALALDDGGGAKTFRPAYELVRDDEERLGRDR